VRRLTQEEEPIELANKLGQLRDLSARTTALNQCGGQQKIMTPTPQAQKLPIAPIFIAHSVSLAVSNEKDGKPRAV
jgi:hypothetical protein